MDKGKGEGAPAPHGETARSWKKNTWDSSLDCWNICPHHDRLLGLDTTFDLSNQNHYAAHMIFVAVSLKSLQ